MFFALSHRWSAWRWVSSAISVSGVDVWRHATSRSVAGCVKVCADGVPCRAVPGRAGLRGRGAGAASSLVRAQAYLSLAQSTYRTATFFTHTRIRCIAHWCRRRTVRHSNTAHTACTADPTPALASQTFKYNTSEISVSLQHTGRCRYKTRTHCD